jgi:2-polyprenyl-3-methyl-5-hydroxy-6-metoxy-1,4-benzoquinol methylase
MNLTQLFFEFQYRFRKPPWDSGITPPEVVRWIASHAQRGRALDLGCGTGTNAIYLAQQGFHVVGVDFANKAIATARAKAQRAGCAIEFHAADVTRLDFLRDSFDYVLDIGCYHGVDPARRDEYVAHLTRLTRPGSGFMLYAFSPRPALARRSLFALRAVGATPEEIRQRFARAFTLEHLEHGADFGERTSAWYWFTRQT